MARLFVISLGVVLGRRKSTIELKRIACDQPITTILCIWFEITFSRLSRGGGSFTASRRSRR
jgi:hypothetical protein